MDNNLFDESLLITNGKIPIVREIIPEILIYQHYEPRLHLGTQHSPLRIEKKTPSFGLYENNGKLCFKDHGHGQQGDVYDFVQQWYKVRKNVEISNKDINRTIYYDMKLSNRKTVDGSLFYNDIEVGPRQFKNTKGGKFRLQVNDVGWTDWAMAYWIERYNISPAILNAYYVGHAKEVWATPPGKKTYLWGVSTRENPIYYFYFPESGNMKCYRPMEKNKKKKWIMNCDNNTDIQGYAQIQIKQTLPKLIIFTKALKEIMFYRSFHVDAIAIHGENHHFNPDFIRHIKKYSTHQLSIYDGDWPGKRAAIDLKNRHNIPAFLIQGAKNITDLWEIDKSLVMDHIELLKEAYQL